MIINVTVKYGSGKPEKYGDILTIHTDKPMKNNQANYDVIKQIAAYYNVEVRNVRIIRGAKRRNKSIEVNGLKEKSCRNDHSLPILKFNIMAHPLKRLLYQPFFDFSHKFFKEFINLQIMNTVFPVSYRYFTVFLLSLPNYEEI